MALMRTRLHVGALFAASCLAFMAAAARPPGYAQEESTNATRELEQMEQRLATTWKAGDCSAWGAMLVDDWSVTHITGAIITKAEALQMCHTPAAPIVRFDIDEVRVRPFGDTAVVTGRSTVAIGGTSPAAFTLRFADVFIRRDGTWKVIASHATRVAAQ